MERPCDLPRSNRNVGNQLKCFWQAFFFSLHLPLSFFRLLLNTCDIKLRNSMSMCLFKSHETSFFYFANVCLYPEESIINIEKWEQRLWLLSIVVNKKTSANRNHRHRLLQQQKRFFHAFCARERWKSMREQKFDYLFCVVGEWQENWDKNLCFYCCLWWYGSCVEVTTERFLTLGSFFFGFKLLWTVSTPHELLTRRDTISNQPFIHKLLSCFYLRDYWSSKKVINLQHREKRSLENIKLTFHVKQSSSIALLR